MSLCMAIHTEHITLLYLVHKRLDTRSTQDSIANGKVLPFPISMMELKARRVVLATFHAIKFTFVTPEPVSNI